MRAKKDCREYRSNQILRALILDWISLDYHHVLQAAAGTAAEAARDRAIEKNRGNYFLIVNGSMPARGAGARSTTGGKSGLSLVRTVGTCTTLEALMLTARSPK